MSGADNAIMDRNLALEAVRVTEATALSVAHLKGAGDERAVDQAAIAAMQASLDALGIIGTVVNGCGDEETAPLLYTGQKLGFGHGPAVDIALLPLEGSTMCAKDTFNAVSVVAMAERGGFLRVPQIYMDKIAVGPGLPPGIVDLDRSAEENLTALAEAKGVATGDLLVCVLDRPRHEELIGEIREAGARVMLIADGDVSGVIATALAATGVDAYMGIGGAPEGVLAAAALACVGGQMQARLAVRGEEQRRIAQKHAITDFQRKYDLADLASGEVMFAATGITDGMLLKGLRRNREGASTHSLVMRSKSGTVRFIEAWHQRRSNKTGLASP
jgi:fructose-1,6-bisphosphatase II / sedoheptulose-1,7-bisphosphatase